jgi:hypothetical protein
LEPGKVETELNWYTWDEKFENYLAAHIGSATVPLDYVVCRNKDDDWDPEVDAATEHERQRYQMVLDGPEFTHDDKVVYLKLKGFCLDTPAWELIREFDAEMSGRSAIEALREHYEGAGEISKRVTIARATLTNTNYQNE